VSRLPLHPTVTFFAPPLINRFRNLFERSLMEQSAVERLGRAAFASTLLWLAIWWASS
jgi:hypothetical protein